MRKKLFLGVDGGGTKTKVRLVTEDGDHLGDALGGVGNIKTSPQESWFSITAAIQNVISLDEIKKYEVHAMLGMAGTEHIAASKAFKRLKPEFIETMELVSDGHIACAGAHNAKNGAIIILGTGVLGYQIENGIISSVCGWGFPQSDEGGAAWIGMEAARLAFQSHDGVVAKTEMTKAILDRFHDNPFDLLDFLVGCGPADFGSFAPFVTKYALQGDIHAIALLKRAASYINNNAKSLLAKQKSIKPLPVALLGGLAEHLEPYLDVELKARLVERLDDTVAGSIWLLKAKFVKTCCST